MIRKALYILSLLTASQYVKAQKVFLTDATWKPGVKVHVVDQAYKADLLVYEVRHNWQAEGKKLVDGLWKVVDYSWQADYTIIFVEHTWQADINIYYCNYEYQAGWRSNKTKFRVD